MKVAHSKGQPPFRLPWKRTDPPRESRRARRVTSATQRHQCFMPNRRCIHILTRSQLDPAPDEDGAGSAIRAHSPSEETTTTLLFARSSSNERMSPAKCGFRTATLQSSARRIASSLTTKTRPASLRRREMPWNAPVESTRSIRGAFPGDHRTRNRWMERSSLQRRLARGQ